MSTYLYRLSRWCFRHRWATLASWILIVTVAVIGAQAGGGKTDDNFSIPGTESQQAVSVLKDKLPAASGASTQVVFAAPDGQDITDATKQKAITQAVRDLGALPQVTQVSNPFETKLVSPDKQIALATVTYDTAAGNVKDATVDKLEPATAAAEDADVQVAFSGDVYPEDEAGVNSEAIGMAVALLVLLVTFGSFVAGGMPLITALFGVIISMMSITMLAAVFDIASAATSVATMLGLSCGIDYALFIVSRHRANLQAGHSPEEAAGRAAGTAGSSVLFAGLSVIIALCGLTVVGIPFLSVMGLTAAGTVAIGLLIALTLLPAFLGFAGKRMGRFSRLPGMRRARAATETSVNAPEELTGTRWANWVVRHRIPVLVVGVLGLGLMAVPAASMDLGLPGADARPTSDTSRQAYDLTTEHFGPGYNGTLTIVAENVDQSAQAQAISSALTKVDGVASAAPAAVVNDIALISVVPTTGPSDSATSDLVHDIRDHRTELAAGTGARLLVGGATATHIDIATKLGDALPIFLIVVVGLAFVLLTFAFRTILVPLKSIAGFLLSAGAAFGAQVAVFQWGWFKDALGVTPTQTLCFLPIILLAIMFGLSSDYEIFVVSRVKEHYTKHGDARAAAVAGTGLSTRVVTAAALIMVSIFVAVMTETDPVIKAIGFSFAIGVFLDAFIVRLALVPAFMAIVGSKIWYHPKWYGRLIPDPDIEGEKLEERLDHNSTGRPEQPVHADA
ncbi:MMPL family transporter [Streptomyces hygroscopicus]|uniref:MMPL family transporter n=1 Tax=Streptomyces hygroscopicus TaxID=1912 RepID=UPI00082568A6|nr:MMPL family transporter [Streptomyces hygroscopicus]